MFVSFPHFPSFIFQQRSLPSSSASRTSSFLSLFINSKKKVQCFTASGVQNSAGSPRSTGGCWKQLFHVIPKIPWSWKICMVSSPSWSFKRSPGRGAPSFFCTDFRYRARQREKGKKRQKGMRAWSVIGTLEDCLSVFDWPLQNLKNWCAGPSSCRHESTCSTSIFRWKVSENEAPHGKGVERADLGLIHLWVGNLSEVLGMGKPLVSSSLDDLGVRFLVETTGWKLKPASSQLLELYSAKHLSPASGSMIKTIWGLVQPPAKAFQTDWVWGMRETLSRDPQDIWMLTWHSVVELGHESSSNVKSSNPYT